MRPDKNTQKRQLKHNFYGHHINPDGLAIIKDIEDTYVGLGILLIELTPQGREQSIALSDLEKSKMFAVATIARDPQYILEEK